MKSLFLTEINFDALCAQWAQRGLVATVQSRNSLSLERIDLHKAAQTIALRCARAYTSPKALLQPARELVALYSTVASSSASPEVPEVVIPEQLIVLGARNCDLVAIAFTDRLFMDGEYKDPFYAEHRKRLIFVSTDCVVDAESCFCDLIDVDPFPTEGYDVNLSPVTGGYVVVAGTTQGENLIDANHNFFTDASAAQLAERDEMRQAVTAKIVSKNQRFRTKKPISQVIQEAIDSPDWDLFARLCVECGACTNICPTCHCFYLFDRLNRESASPPGQVARLREWDSCIYADYARMAGREAGKPNPRPRLRSRLENRFTHKYLYIPHNYGVFGCSGCGRCFDACSGGIDPREVFKKLEKE